MAERPLVLIVILAVLASAGAVQAGSSSELDRHDAFEELDALLTRAVVPPDGTVCSVSLEQHGSAPIDLGCDAAAGHTEQTEVVTSAGSAGATGVDLATRDLVNTPRWHAQIASFGASDGSFVRFHGFGDVAAHGPDGEQLWNRAAMSFYDDWGIDNRLVPFVLMGVAPINPLTRASDRAFAVGDLTGDGVEDIALSHYLVVPQNEESEDLNEGARVRRLSTVTVLDGRDGATLWFRRYPGYVTHVLTMDGVLVVANETGDENDSSWRIGEDGTTSALHALTFDAALSGLAATDVWTLDLGLQYARWLALEPMADGRFAVSWTDTPLGSDAPRGHLLGVDVASGAVAWERERPHYPRALRYDATRDRIWVHEQADPVNLNERLDYWINGFNAETGLQSGRIQRSGAVLLSFELGDVAGDTRLEVLTGDLEQHRQTPAGALSRTFEQSRVTAYDPDHNRTLWQDRVEMLEEYQAERGGGLASLPHPYGLAVSETFDDGRVVLVGTLSRYGDGMRALRGPDGGELWERWGNVTYPLSLVSTAAAGEPAVLTMTQNKVVRAYHVGTGDTVIDAPILADIYAAETLDVNGDGLKDVLVGGESGAVFALDGADLDDSPAVLWRTTLGGADTPLNAEWWRMIGEGIRQLTLADLDGDGSDELVVAASSALAALDPGSGEVLWRHERPGDYVWTFALGDLDGQAGLDVVVNTRTLTGYRGADGEQLWEYRPSKDNDVYFAVPAITPDGVVVSQFLVPFPPPFAPRHHRFIVGLDSATGTERWQEKEVDQFGIVRQWRTVTAAGPTDDGQGTQVALTWDVKENPLGITFRWRPKTDVVDSRTGEVLWSVGPLSSDAVHMGTVHDPDRGLYEFNWYNVTRLERDGGRQVDFDASSDIAWADFGPRGEAFLRGFARIGVYGADEPRRPDGYFPVATQTWDDIFAGSMHVDDLDGDGADEVIAMQFDWPGYARVVAVEGTGVSVSEYYPHGLGVIEAR